MTNRELKFRIWDGNFYYFGSLDDIYQTGYICGLNKPISEMSPQQFTGLHDINDREIYEGDIFNWPAFCRFEVYWNSEFSRFDYRQIDFQELYVTDVGENGWPEDIEVIGNIFENPELIKETK